MEYIIAEIVNKYDSLGGLREKMKYGYFDETKKEYVITRPDTPAPWVNYLGSPEYGAIVSNNAGGYRFAGVWSNYIQ